MLADTLIRAARRPGLHVVHARGAHGSRELASHRLVLPAGERAAYTAPGEETVFVLQQGAATLAVEGQSWPVARKSVFEARATALYLPPGATLTIDASSALEAVLIAAPAARGGSPALVRPGDVRPMSRGRGVYSREVHNLFVDDQHATRLMVGETFNPPGHWSSYPPHKHDGRHGEPTLEEVYHYRVDPPQGFGHQMLYTLDGEVVTHVVRDGDAVVLPYGFHPVSAPPGYRLYYLWGMVGEQRRLALFEDPAHAWIHQADIDVVS